MSSHKLLIAEELSISKWKLALAVGGVVAVGAGIYYYRNYRQDSNSKPNKKSSDLSKSISEDVKAMKLNAAKPNGLERVDKADTPLEKAKIEKSNGNHHFREGHFDEAIDCYNRAIEICPEKHTHDLSTFYQNRAAAFEQKKEYSKVLEDCSSALKLNPRYTKALLRRAKAAEVLNNLDLALEDYTAICIIETFANQESLTVVDRILKQIGMTHAQELFGKKRGKLPSIHSIRSYLGGFCCDPVINSVNSEKEGDQDEAEDMPEKHSATDGYLRARQLLRDELFSDIIDCCTNELANASSKYIAHAYLLRGIMHIIYIDRDSALNDLKTLAEMEESPVKFRVAALVKMGALEVSFNNTENADTHYAKAIILDRKNTDIYHQQGQMFLMMNKVDRAIQNFDKVVELSPNFAIGHVQKLHTNYRFASYTRNSALTDDVIKKFHEARKTFPKCSEVALLLLQILLDEEKYDEANDLFTELLKVEPNNPVALVYRGMLMVQWKGDIEAAKTFIRQSLEIDEQCEMALENLATVHVQTGNLNEGVRLFNVAIPLAKSINEMAHYCSLRDAAVAQIKVVERLGITLPGANAL